MRRSRRISSQTRRQLADEILEEAEAVDAAEDDQLGVSMAMNCLTSGRIAVTEEPGFEKRCVSSTSGGPSDAEFVQAVREGLSSSLRGVVVHLVGSMRPGKVIANALSACFHPWAWWGRTLYTCRVSHR